MPSMYEIYDAHARRYHDLVRHEDVHGTLRAAFQAAAEWDHARVLEAGAGTGRVTAWYIERVAHALACDRSRHMLEEAAHRLSAYRERLEFAVCDNFDISVAAGSRFETPGAERVADTLYITGRTGDAEILDIAGPTGDAEILDIAGSTGDVAPAAPGAPARPAGEGVSPAVHPYDIFVEGWSFGHSVLDNETGSLGIDGACDRLLEEARRSLRPGGTIVLLETLGTATDLPAPPTAGLERFYNRLEKHHGFRRTEARSDFGFESVDQASELTGFFFGDEMGARVRDSGSRLVPEWTGIWTATTS